MHLNLFNQLQKNNAMFFIKLISIIVLSFVLTLFLPWYMPFVVCFVVGLLLSNHKGNNFIAGLLGVGLFWFVYAFYLDINNQHVLSSKIALLFSDKLHTDITSGVLVMVTTFLGAILGGLSAMAGAMISDDASKRKFKRGLREKRPKLNLKYK